MVTQNRYYSSTTRPATTTVDPGTSGVTLTVVDSTVFSSLDGKYPYALVINTNGADREVVYVTARPSGTTLTITRGRDGTTGQAHAVGSVVEHMAIAADLNELSNHMAYDGFNVRDFGATGNGSTDDAAAIQAALDLASSTYAGSTLYFPAGTYKVSSELEIKGAVKIVMDEGCTVIRGVSTMQYVFKNFNASYAPTLYAGRGNITVTGGTVDGNAAAFTTTVTAFIIAHADTVTFDGVTFQNVVDWHGLEINSSRNVVVRNCTTQGLRIVTAGRYISEAFQIDLAKDLTVIPGIGAGALDNTPCDNVLFDGCTVRASSLYGSFGALTGSHSFTDGFKHTNIKVVNCHGEDLHDYLVNAYNWDDVTVSNNEVLNSNAFLGFQLPASGVTADMFRLNCTGNRIYNSGTLNANAAINPNAADISGKDATAAGNVIREVVFSNNSFYTAANAGAFVQFLNVADVMCVGNLMKSGTGTSTDGIVVQGSSQGNYGNNKIVDASGVGINVLDGTNINSGFCTIVGNHVYHAGEDAITVNSSEPVLTGNHVVSPGTKTGATTAVWLKSLATNAVFTGNKVRGSSPLPTTGVRNDAASVAVMSANHVTGWTATTTATGASGQNFWFNTASKPNPVNTYNVC